MFNKQSENLIKKVCGIAYKRGFLDGMNFSGEEEIEEEEFEKLGIATIIDEAINKIKAGSFRDNKTKPETER